MELEGGEGSASRPRRYLPQERPRTHCTGGWVGPRAGLDRCRISRAPPGFDPRTVHPVAVAIPTELPAHDQSTMLHFFLIFYSNTLHFSHVWANWSSPYFSSTTFQNLPAVSDLLPEASKFQHHTNLCSKRSASLKLSPIVWIKVFFVKSCFYHGNPGFNFTCSS